MATIGEITGKMSLDSSGFVSAAKKATDSAVKMKKELSKTASSAARFDKSINKVDLSEVVNEIKKANTHLSSIGDKMKSTAKSAQKIRPSIVSLRGAFASLATAMSVKQLSAYADTWKLVEGRLSLVTKSTEDLLKVQENLFVMAQRTRGAFEDTADLYARISRSTKALAFEQRDMLAVTEAINKSIIVSGSSTESANAAIMQLGQGFASGTLRGEELNSVLEQTPRLAEAIATGMGVTIGQLRALGAEGELTAEKVFNAILKQKDVIDKEFGKMPVTIGQSFTVLNNEILKFIGQTDKATGASANFASSIVDLSKAIGENQDELREWLYVLTLPIAGAHLLVKSAIIAFKNLENYFELTALKIQKIWAELVLEIERSLHTTSLGAFFAEKMGVDLEKSTLEVRKLDGAMARVGGRIQRNSQGLAETAGIYADLLKTSKQLAATSAPTAPAGDGGGAGPDLALGKDALDAIAKYNNEVLKQKLHAEDVLNNLQLQNQMIQNNVGGIKFLNELRDLGVGLETETGRQLIEQMALRDQLKEIGVAPQAGMDEKEREKLAERLVRIQESFMSEQELLSLHIAQKRALIDESFAQDMISEAERKILFENLEREHQIRLSEINNTGVANRLKFEKMSAKEKTKTVLGEMQTLTAGVANSNKTLFRINKIAALAQAAIAFPSGIMKTMEAFPYPINIAMAGLHGAAMLQQISSIKSASFGGGGGSTTTPSGGGGAVTTAGIAPSDTPGPATEEATAVKEVTINLGDRPMISTEAVRELIEAIQEEAGDMGLNIQVAS